MNVELSRITYVEDEPDIRAVAQIALTQLGGFQVDVCTCGQEAIEKAPEFSPDLILLDVMMPGLDGLETYRKLKEIPALEETPVIFMTAKVQKQEVESYLELGAKGVVPKPFDPLTLAQQVSECWKATRLEQA